MINSLGYLIIKLFKELLLQSGKGMEMMGRLEKTKQFSKRQVPFPSIKLVILKVTWQYIHSTTYV